MDNLACVPPGTECSSQLADDSAEDWCRTALDNLACCPEGAEPSSELADDSGELNMAAGSLPPCMVPGLDIIDESVDNSATSEMVKSVDNLACSPEGSGSSSELEYDTSRGMGVDVLGSFLEGRESTS